MGRVSGLGFPSKLDHLRASFSLQKKEAVGDDDSLPETVSQKLTELTKEVLDPLTVTQLKKVRALIDEAMAKNNEDLARHETARDGLLRELGNWLHPSVPVSNDEVSFALQLLSYESTAPVACSIIKIRP